jgi:hypothetical protein
MKRIASLLIPASMLTAGIASAQADKVIDRDPDSHLAFELRFGPYRPSVDDAPLAGRPYEKAFGDTTRFMLGGEVDWQPIHIKHFASIGVGGMFGYTRATANAKFSDGSGESAEDTTFSLWLLSALAVMRVDVLARETWIPIVPYAKIGPGFGFWTASNGTGTVEVNGVVGKGRTFGMIYTVGGAFLLDAIDRQAAKTFSAEQGVHHTYFFFEYMMAQIKQSGQMNVGDNTWQLGLAVEM